MCSTFDQRHHDVYLSEHGLARMRQRGIDPAGLELLLRYGAREHDHKGGRILYFSHRSLRRMVRDLGSGAHGMMEKCAQLYAVTGGDGEIITVGHRYRRILRDRKPVKGKSQWGVK